MALFILLNIIVGYSSFLLAAKLARGYSKPDFLISWFILFLAQIILIELTLGLLGKLSIEYISILSILICGSVFYLTRKDVTYPEFSGKEALEILANKQLILAFSVFFVFFLAKGWINLVNPPICPESHQYHFSFPATWLRNANLINPIVIFGSKPNSADLTALTYYPMNAELWFFWLMAPLRNAFLADLGEAPFYLMGILAIYSILRKFSINKNTALFAGFLWVLIPNVFKQFRNGSQIDVLCAALILAYLNYLLILTKEAKIRNAILLGICTGFLFGTKVLNIYWLIGLLPFSLFCFFRIGKAYSLKRLSIVILTIIFSMVIFGGFSYIRTFILTGNFLYPVKIMILGKELLPGFISKADFSKMFVDKDGFNLTRLIFREGLGIQFFAFILPGTFIPFLFAVFSKDKKEYPAKILLLFLAPLLMFLLFLFVIKAYWTRYLFPYLGIGLIAAVIFLNRFKWGKWYISICGVASILIASGSLANRLELVFSIIGSILLFIFLIIFSGKIKKNTKRIFSRKVFIAGVFILILALIVLNSKYNREEFDRYPLTFRGKEIGQRDTGIAWKWLNSYTGKGKRVAYTGYSEFYPLFGSGIKNDVYYISVNKGLPFAHYYPDGLYRKEKNFDDWKENLRKERIEVLFVALPHPLNNESEDLKMFSIEDQWAVAHPNDFQLLYSNSLCHIYKVALTDKQVIK